MGIQLEDDWNISLSTGTLDHCIFKFTCHGLFRDQFWRLKNTDIYNKPAGDFDYSISLKWINCEIFWIIYYVLIIFLEMHHEIDKLKYTIAAPLNF